MLHHQYPFHVCMQYMHRYVKIQTVEGHVHEGIIVHVDHENIILAVPEGMEQPGMVAVETRFFGPGPFFPGFRFRPFLFPFGRIGGIFPFFFPFI